jgi:hypothetical protein
MREGNFAIFDVNDLGISYFKRMERDTRFERATFCMASRRTTNCANPADKDAMQFQLLTTAFLQINAFITQRDWKEKGHFLAK